MMVLYTNIQPCQPLTIGYPWTVIIWMIAQYKISMVNNNIFIINLTSFYLRDYRVLTRGRPISLHHRII